MIYDCFTLFHELDILEIRLHELNDIVDKFVICEAKYTHSGQPKELFFQKNKKRFEKFLPKIIHLVCNKFPNMTYAPGDKKKSRLNENYQRDYLKHGLTDCKSTDIIIISDLDEIPRKTTIQNIISKMNSNKVYVFKHKTFYYYLNYYSVDWNAAKMFTFAKMKQKTPANKTNKNGLQMTQISPQFMRDYWSGNDVIKIPNAGWHFGWCYGKQLKDRVLYKTQCMGHQEYNNNKYRNTLMDKIKNKIDVRNRKITKLKIDKTFPIYVQDNIQHFIDLEMINP